MPNSVYIFIDYYLKDINYIESQNVKAAISLFHKR